MQGLTVMMFHSPQIVFPEGSTPHIQLILRWIHFAAGITWVGMLYFFVLINAKFLPAMEPATRMKVVPLLMPRALWWFRWSVGGHRGGGNLVLDDDCRRGRT